MKELSNKRVLVTGAGHGLGQELSKSLAAAGAEVIVTDRDQVRVAETVNMICEAGQRASGYLMDVTNLKSVREVRKQLNTTCGPIDVLVNNAGVVFGGPFLKVPLERHFATYQINTIGLITVTHTFLPDLISRPESHLVNIASASGLIALPFAATYASSKWAVLGFSRSLLEELVKAGHKHVKVTTVCPSYISTGMFKGVRSPFLTPQLTPQKVSRLTLNAIQKNKEQVFTPILVKMLPFLKGIMPRFIFRNLLDFFGVFTGMASWCGHQAPDETQTITSPMVSVTQNRRLFTEQSNRVA